MKTLLDATSIKEIQRRMERLRQDAFAVWGRMTAPQMVCHLIDGFRVALGEEPVTARWTPLRIYPLRWVLVYVLPWPKGTLPIAPELQRTQPTTCVSSASDIHNSSAARPHGRAEGTTSWR